VGLISQQNLTVGAIGVLLFVTFISVMQIRNGASGELDRNLNSTKQEDKTSKTQDTTLIEPGLYQVEFPERFNFPPEKLLLQLTQDSSAPYYRYQSNDNVSTYEISYVRFPEDTFAQKNASAILNDLTQGELTRFSAILKKETTSNESANLIKREIELQSGDGSLFIRTMLIVNRPYVYLVCYTSKNKGNLYNSKIQAFFDSFRLFEQMSPKTIIVNSNVPKQIEPNNNLVQPNNLNQSTLNTNGYGTYGQGQ
jgi:hypothetical protein